MTQTETTREAFAPGGPLRRWLRPYYVKWMETCENQRWITDGRGPRHPTGVVPFLPFGEVPALPYHHFLTALIAGQLCHLGDLLETPLGNAGHMATIIEDGADVEDPPRRPCPFILVEKVFGGIVTDYRMFRDARWEDVEVYLQQAGIGDRLYKKIVTIEFLRRLCDLHGKWLTEGDNARYLLGFFQTLSAGISEKQACISPRPPALENLRRIGEAVELGDLDVWAVFRRYSNVLPNLVIEGRGGDVPIPLSAPYTLVITEPGLLALLDGLKFSTNLPDLFSFLVGYAAQGMESGWFRIGGTRWTSKVSAAFLRRRLHALPKKVQVLTTILGNPYHVLLLGDGLAFLGVLRDGLPESIRRVPVEEKDGAGAPLPLLETWVRASHRYGYIHLALRLREDAAHRGTSLQELVEFAPESDFVLHFLREGAFQVLLHMALPFLKA